MPAGVEWQKDRKTGSFDRNKFFVGLLINRHIPDACFIEVLCTEHCQDPERRVAAQLAWLRMYPKEAVVHHKDPDPHVVSEFHDWEMLRKQKIKVLGSLKGNR